MSAFDTNLSLNPFDSSVFATPVSAQNNMDLWNNVSNQSPAVDASSNYGLDLSPVNPNLPATQSYYNNQSGLGTLATGPVATPSTNGSDLFSWIGNVSQALGGLANAAKPFLSAVSQVPQNTTITPSNPLLRNGQTQQYTTAGLPMGSANTIIPGVPNLLIYGGVGLVVLLLVLK